MKFTYEYMNIPEYELLYFGPDQFFIVPILALYAICWIGDDFQEGMATRMTSPPKYKIKNDHPYVEIE